MADKAAAIFSSGTDINDYSADRMCLKERILMLDFPLVHI